ncbi:hypothetical protein [Streptomyces sp. NPDC047043]|uniref:hypothetical protein n=1 Tax=Streptomyces sp. NPDC047043 TaxID=3154497 RepID=UPI0033C44422
MDWRTAIMCGVLGGFVIEAIAFYGQVSAWQAARREALARRRKKKRLPSLSEHVDVPADSLVALTRLALGGLAGALFHSQIIGMTAAVAVGASAPALLRQLGAVRQVQAAFQEPQSLESRPQPLAPAAAEGPPLGPGEVPAE